MTPPPHGAVAKEENVGNPAGVGSRRSLEPNVVALPAAGGCHFFITAPGYRQLTTQIHIDGDKHLHATSRSGPAMT
ncbi:hypothetical protein ACFFWD_02090 [Bradyrhizobium erythrophlei]|uniref:hypothetical protein n=1 Tax=Bradyrhizobium erythrophlei TaxID=1437360 RepID=UPI0035EAFEAB